MKRLIGKYRSGSMTPQEFEELRRRSNEIGDDELANAIYEDWMSFAADEPVDDEARQRIYSRIASGYFNRRPSIVSRALRVAAVAAIAIIAGAGAFLFMQHVNSSGAEAALAAVSTGPGERATVKMPDGSAVSLNGNSTMEYALADFAGNASRRVRFSGEGLFDIAAADGKAFIVETPTVDVTVKGTVFNLEAAKDRDYTTLALLEGRVSIKSGGSGQEVEMSANEKAVVNNLTGQIAVSPISDNDNPTGWNTKKLFFKNAPMRQVISQIEKNADCRLIVADSLQDKHFTGLIPISNVGSAAIIIEKAFNTTVTISRD